MSSQGTNGVLREKWVSVKGVPTYTLCQGSKKDHNTVIIIIPGNPGVAEYYADFMQEIHRHCHLPIRCVSHAGHVTIPQLNFPYKKDNSYLSLDGQIQHKLAYICDYIPTNKRLILIGHSIGCYMIIKMLSDSTDHFLAGSSVSKCYFLFPTVERMAQTPNGQFFTPLLKYFYWAIRPVTYLLVILPDNIKRFLVERYFGVGQIPRCAVEATVKLLSPSSCQNCCYLASIEMQSVTELDVDAVDKNINRFCFYYGGNDAWCPIEYFHSMKSLFPDGQIQLCQCDIQHAFVLKNSKQMAAIVSSWLQELTL